MGCGGKVEPGVVGAGKGDGEGEGDGDGDGDGAKDGCGVVTGLGLLG